ncbi:MAG: hypothetical protein K0S61_3858 [Anaerocolumna sp.]|jgi:hypothetical protein|nr:hypothetical protein [Anaerocolumna sp.]
MDSIGYIFGILALLWCYNLSAKLEKMKHIMKDNGLLDYDKASLKEILENNKGHYGKINLDSFITDFEINGKYCLIQDIDEDWVLIKEEKKEIDKLIRIESIKSIQFKH